MNIFKLGLLLSVLIFNLSCGIIPDEPDQFISEVTETNYVIENNDINVTDHSFITLESPSEPNLQSIIHYLDDYGINSESTIEEIDQLPHELRFTSKQTNELEEEVNLLESPSIQKKILQAYINKLREVHKE